MIFYKYTYKQTLSMTTVDWQQRAQNIDLNIRNFIAGDYAEVPQGKFIQKYSPRDGSLLYQLPIGTATEMERAIISAKLAHGDKRWRGLPLHQRQIALRELADLMDTHQETLGLYECLDAGKPISQALNEVTMASDIIRQAADGADKLFSPYIADGAYCAYQLRKPVGIVGAIIPWELSASDCGFKNWFCTDYGQ